MNNYLIKNATIHAAHGVLENATVALEDGYITAEEWVENATEIDTQGWHLVPGFIDLQLNGGFGHDFTSNPETIWQVAAELPRYGVTAFLPTIITSPPETISQAQAVLAAGPPKPKNWRGARPLGLHIEGPFFNPAKKGAHNANYLREPSPAAVASWTADNHVKLVTLAPELPNALETIKALRAQGVTVSAGHSMATLAEAQAGFTAGITYGTHLFNAMPPLHHREPGLSGALLENDSIITGIIPDGIHTHPAMVKLAWQAKRHRLNLVTDAMAALGMPPGRYTIGSQEVIVTETDARLADGTLAGSILPLDQALRNLITFTNGTLTEALPTVTTTPTNLLSLPHTHGRITDGSPADVVLLDENLEVRMTFVGGELVYQKG